ncbi:MAG: hypothetical protein A2070_09680 [Bdellovibrionales bacterium GWC1_52_8]|nr:MAG: hypothetical protein A2070_09680 [Bdellovibrionales bacterium GWC1_52_8]
MSMARKMRLSEIPERRSPGDEEPVRGSPGSIEQQLDMSEEGDLRGDEIQFHHGIVEDERDEGAGPLDLMMSDNYNVDMSEENREGDELSGDEHSFGLQGDKEQQLEDQVRKVRT